jgi:hypothetical protein
MANTRFDRLHGITVTWRDGEESDIRRLFQAGKSDRISRLWQAEVVASGP